VTDPNADPGIVVAQVYLEEASFAHRPDAMTLPADTKPEVTGLNLEIQVSIQKDQRAGFIRIRMATPEEPALLYRVSLSMIGLFTQQPGRENMAIADFLKGPAVPFMFPFLREAFANLTWRGRFGPLWINPFNTTEVSRGLGAAAEQAMDATPERDVAETEEAKDSEGNPDHSD
jgi:preprotein translocase subunit SecB